MIHRATPCRTNLAESIAQGLNAKQVEQCKANALYISRGKPLIYATICYNFENYSQKMKGVKNVELSFAHKSW
jgi:hypothetical protein